MTCEEALYYKLMLQAGVSDKFYEWYDRALERENYNDLILEIALNPSDIQKILLALNNHIADITAIDQEVVFDYIWGDLHELWESGKTDKATLCDIMYVIAVHTECFFGGGVWYSLFNMKLFYDEMKEGIISQESFDKMFNDFLQHKIPISQNDPFEAKGKAKSFLARIKGWFKKSN